MIDDRRKLIFADKTIQHGSDIMIYVKEHDGKYYVANAKWCKAYETGAVDGKKPVAGFINQDDAELFVSVKNRGGVVHKEICAPKAKDYEDRRSTSEIMESFVYGGKTDPTPLILPKGRYTPTYRSKEEAVRASLTHICDQYQIHVKFKSGVATVTTAAGEWFFRYNDRPIQLFHKNGTEGAINPKVAVHNQNLRFYSPVDVLRYIMLHDLKRTSRLLDDI